MSVDNSFFHQDYHNLNVLVIVPHEDDEINAAAALLYNFTSCGAKVHIVYTTNGDYQHTAETRFREAIKAANTLGVVERNVIFLGYADAYNNTKRDHLFYNTEKIATSNAGYKETYGTELHPDYAYAKFGTHHHYTANNYLQDIKSVIEQLLPDVIICTDFDEHPDHKMLSLYFDKAVGKIIKKHKTYHPLVLKRFAYALAYTAVADFTAINNPETQRPCLDKTEKYPWDFIDKFYYNWAHRVRIPLPVLLRERNLKKNEIAKALLQHESQFIITRADRIINSDEVYWLRRTDSLTYGANVIVSSGNADALTDFMLYNVNDVDVQEPSFVDCHWQPDEDDTVKTARFSWMTGVCIETIVLYGDITDQVAIKKLEVSLSDGSVAVVENVPADGRPLIVNLGVHKNITYCELKLCSVQGKHYGISECEIYPLEESKSVLRPFCKILIDDNFVYEYLTDIKTEKLPVKCYTFGDTGEMTFKVMQGNAYIKDNYLYFGDANKGSLVILRAENEAQTVYDQIIIKKLTTAELKQYQAIDEVNKRFLKKKILDKKIHNMINILENEGLKAVLKKVAKKIWGAVKNTNES